MAHPLQSFFSGIKLFSRLTAGELNDILRAVQPVQLNAGQRLFSQGDPGDAAFVIEAGSIDVFTEVDGEEVPVATLSVGEVLGELSLLDGAPRSASARANEETRLFRLDKQEFDFLRRNLRPAAFKLIREMAGTVCDRIRATNVHIAELLAGDVPAPDAPQPEHKRARGWLSRIFTRGDA